MAADLLILGIEITAAVTAALVLVFILRRPVRALFGARAAYCLWLLVPAVVLAVALPRAPAPAAEPATVAAASAGVIAAPAVAAVPVESTPAALFDIERPDFMPNPKDFAVPLLALWAFGVLAYAGVLILGQRRFVRAMGPLRAEQRADGPVYHAARPDIGPALVGAFSPRLVLPGDFAERFSPEEQAVVVAHERVHLAAGDAQINLAVAAARTLLWFHPLIHLAARLIRADQELACDETVVARLPALRRLYAEAMLKTQFAAEPAPLGCHWLAGDKRELRRRIARLKLTPSRARRIGGVALAAALTVAGGAAAWAVQPASQSRSEERAPAVSGSTRDLLQAIEAGDHPRAVALIAAGADVDGWILGDGSPLILAVRGGQVELARLLLDHGANPNQAVPGEGAPLIMAADAGDLAMARLLLERRASPNVAVEGDGNPLIVAAAGGHLAMVDLLLASGAQVDAVVRNDETALITAARFGHLPVVERLVERGADVNLAVLAPRIPPYPDEMRSPLGMARRAGRADIVDYLRAHGARA
jgi:beta-lactamase regulating signal transducer with metallopeptidase domain